MQKLITKVADIIRRMHSPDLSYMEHSPECRSLGNDQWNCGHKDNSESERHCDCSCCVRYRKAALNLTIYLRFVAGITASVLTLIWVSPLLYQGSPFTFGAKVFLSIFALVASLLLFAVADDFFLDLSAGPEKED